jgi:RNA polymerase sigma-70 factor (ECF subfamily)
LHEDDLNALGQAVRQGDPRAFRTLVETLSRPLIALAYRYTNDWEWARDLTQDTWARVHQRIDRYDPGRSFSAWLHAVHRNGCLDHLRRKWVRHEAMPGDEVLARLGGPALDDPHADLERKEFHERLLMAVRSLSESQRQVFLRVDLEQTGQKEVARALGMKPGTLRATLHYARRRVAAALRGMEGASQLEEGT